VLSEAKKRNCKNLLQLDAVVLAYGYVALRMKKYEMDMRDYLS
jgi:hypothetical protein